MRCRWIHHPPKNRSPWIGSLWCVRLRTGSGMRNSACFFTGDPTAFRPALMSGIPATCMPRACRRMFITRSNTARSANSAIKISSRCFAAKILIRTTGRRWLNGRAQNMPARYPSIRIIFPCGTARSIRWTRWIMACTEILWARSAALSKSADYGLPQRFTISGSGDGSCPQPRTPTFTIRPTKNFTVKRFRSKPAGCTPGAIRTAGATASGWDR